jgi:hypothetical protein
LTQKKRPHFVIRGQNFGAQVARDNINDSPKFSVGGELGNDFVTWSLRGRPACRSERFPQWHKADLTAVLIHVRFWW